MKKRIVMFFAAAMAAVCATAEPIVTEVTAKQRYPWNGLVDIDCKVSGIEGTANGYKFVVVAVDKDTGKEYTASHLTAKHVDVTAAHGGSNVPEGGVTENGDYELLWDARTDMGQVVVERMAMLVTLETVGVSAEKVQLWSASP